MKIHEIQWNVMEFYDLFYEICWNLLKSDDVFMKFVEIYQKVNEIL